VKVLLPLKQRERLVDQRQHVHPQRLRGLLHVDRRVKLLNRLLVLLLIEQQLPVVIVHVWHFVEVLDRAAEGRHGRGDGAHLVLRDAELDVREDEVLVELDRLLVVFGRFGEFAEDEVELGAVVVDIWVVFVLLRRLLKVIGCGVFVT